MNKLFCVALAATMMSAPALATRTPITYKGTHSVDGITADVSITTDGSLGSLQTTNITRWSVAFTQGDLKETIKGNSVDGGASILFLGKPVTATDTTLDFAVDTGLQGLLEIKGRVEGVRSFVGFGGSPIGGFYLSVMPSWWTNEDVDNRVTLGNGSFTLGTVSTGAIPEPASWAMMIIGFGAVGVSLRRRSLATVAA